MPTFNTLKFSDALKAAGVPVPQADAYAHALADGLNAPLSELATKSELKQVATELHGEMAQLSAELRGEMGQLSTELRGEMGQLSTELRGEMAQLSTELRGEMRQLSMQVRHDVQQLSAELRNDTREAELRLHGEIAPMKWMLATVSTGMVAMLFSTVALLFKAFA